MMILITHYYRTKLYQYEENKRYLVDFIINNEQDKYEGQNLYGLILMDNPE